MFAQFRANRQGTRTKKEGGEKKEELKIDIDEVAQ